eukprot:jgi/Mesvir1/26547/Mv16202-RA.1
MEFRTVQGSSVKLLIESLKELTNDVNVRFDADGVHITAMDGCHCALFHVNLQASKIEEYSCTHSFTVGVSLLNLYKLLKNVSSNDELELKLDRSRQEVMEINIVNKVKNTRWAYSMKLLDIDENSLEIPEKEYSVAITMVSSEFQKICRDLSVISDTVRVRCDGRHLTMSCSGDIGDCHLDIGDEFPDMNVDVKDAGEAIDEVYSLRYLCTFSKSSGMCNSVQLFLSHDYPIILKYKVGDLGVLMFALAPKIDSGGDDNTMSD